MDDYSSKISQPLKNFYIPDYILVPDAEPEEVSDTPACPVIVFINSKSGGQLGGDLLKTYRELLNSFQVLLDPLEKGVAQGCVVHDHNPATVMVNLICYGHCINLSFMFFYLRFMIWERRLLIRCFTDFIATLKNLSPMEIFLLLKLRGD